MICGEQTQRLRGGKEGGEASCRSEENLTTQRLEVARTVRTETKVLEFCMGAHAGAWLAYVLFVDIGAWS